MHNYSGERCYYGQLLHGQLTNFYMDYMESFDAKEEVIEIQKELLQLSRNEVFDTPSVYPTIRKSWVLYPRQNYHPVQTDLEDTGIEWTLRI